MLKVVDMGFATYPFKPLALSIVLGEHVKGEAIINGESPLHNGRILHCLDLGTRFSRKWDKKMHIKSLSSGLHVGPV